MENGKTGAGTRSGARQPKSLGESLNPRVQPQQFSGSEARALQPSLITPTSIPKSTPAADRWLLVRIWEHSEEHKTYQGDMGTDAWRDL